MHPQEKQAWFTLIVGLATAAVFAPALGLCLYFDKPVTVSFASFALFGLAGLTPFIGRRERRAGKVVMDERDTEIARVSTLAGYSIFWVLFVFAAVGPMLVMGPNAPISIRAHDIATPVFPAMYVVFVVRALVMVILYKKGAVHE
ncbi:hypothetical protein JW916_08110 [Candidatus Sumerlaeota bacterium]|nr:hypothetical protein [Candidatus Sumerlaeota bacterium]